MQQKLINNTGILIILNVISFFLFIIVAYFYGDNFIRYFALQPEAILHGKYLWTFLTSMFIHAGLGHLVANMLSLVFIGGFVEKLLGKKRFLSLYFIGGFIASLFFVVLAGVFGTSTIGERLFGSPITFAVGASGAIFALGGVLAVLTPKLKVLAFFIIPMPMWFAMIVLTFIMWIFSASLSLPIGNTAHFGGLIAGVVYGLYIRYKYPKKTRMISRYFGG